jgi:hypothetical protein
MSARAPSRRTLAVCGTSAWSASDVFSAEYSWKNPIAPSKFSMKKLRACR